ncbi:peptidylprolyl isomerase [Asticcacaulis sp. AND118]|uniref:peptidylprolyl isomerase n=1 Tax=Asticcacaulis sp. AND118 TaxID=2840468 RepID=UPI001CFFC3C8|nr:peptidylprolyl isomerase [Asticcacaulis sp. AND118]UDF02379.1 peptidyl-prolyl cis-trans isomerase [Asticcacaulis sp. AND118]
MISSFRQFTKSLTFKLLMAALILSFAVFGMNDLFSSGSSRDVVDAGERKTTTDDFRRQFDEWKTGAEQQSGQTLTYEDAVKEGLHVRIMEEIADMDSFSAWLIKAGIRPSAKVVTDQIAKYPIFFDSVTGKFDKAKYQEELASRMKLSQTKFEQIINDDIANRQFIEASVAGLKPPRIYAALQSAFAAETRDAAFLIVTPDNVEKPGAPSDAELLKFYEDNKERLRRPELRQFTVVSFAPGDFASKVTVDEAELKKLYEFRRDTLSTPETRSFVQITVPDQTAANAVAQALRSGADAQTAAKAGKGTVVTYDAKPKTAIADAKVADAAFALKEGEVSGAIQGSLGLAVVKLSKVTAASVTGFETVRNQLEQEYKKDKAKELAYAASETFEKERSSGAEFAAAAEKSGVRIINLPPMTAEGQMADGQSFAQYAPILKAAFEQPKGGETDVTELGNGEYFALRVNEVIPSEVPALDKIKPQMIQAWQQKTLGDRVVAKGEEVAARLRKGESVEAVASAMGLKIEARPALARQSAQQSVGPEIAGRIFSAKVNEIFSARANEMVTVVGKVTAINKGDAATVNQATAMTAQSVAYGLFQDMSFNVRKGARTSVKTKTNPNAAVLALGLNPASIKADTKTAEAGKAAK